MARPDRHDVDYFPFFAKRGKTINILQSKFGLEGVGFFTNMMRFLALTPDHHYCINDETDRMNFFAETGVQEEAKGIAMIEMMVKTGKLDKDLWENYKVVVSEDFLLSLNEAYKQRKNQIITIIEIREKFVSIHGNPVEGNEIPVSIHGNPVKCGLLYENEGDNPQSKVKKSKVNLEASPPVVSEDSSPQKSENAKRPPIREREPVNDTERVEKAYLQNWDSLYSQGRVQTPNPLFTSGDWIQIRKLLKDHFEKEKLKPEHIIQAVNNGLKDEWVMGNGYSLILMLTGKVLNRLINAGTGAGPPAAAQGKKSLGGLEI